MAAHPAWVRSRFWLVAAVLGIAALFVLGAQPFAVGIVPPPFDKLAHAVAFAILFLVLDNALMMPLWLALCVPLLVSAADELHQLVLPGREPGLGDWLAGLLGVFAAAILRAVWRRH